MLHPFLNLKFLLNYIKRCKFRPKCTPFNDFLSANANDQLDLKGTCTIGCESLLSSYEFYYNVYYMTNNKLILVSSNTTKYFTSSGPHKSDLSVASSLFNGFASQLLWKFELNLFMPSGNFIATTSLLISVNHPPKSGSCNIKPKNGTTQTWFNIYCDSWMDDVGTVTAFAFYGNNMEKFLK